MGKLTVKCSNPNCGIFFDTINPFGGVKDSELTFTNCSLNNCPRCGSAALMADGVYNFDKDGILTILQRPEFTPEVLYQLHQAAIVAHDERHAPEHFKAEVASIGVPDAFFTLVVPQDASGFYTFLSFLIYAIEKVWRSAKNRAGNSFTKKKKKKKEKKRMMDEEEYRIRKEYGKKQRGTGL